MQVGPGYEERGLALTKAGHTPVFDHSWHHRLLRLLRRLGLREHSVPGRYCTHTCGDIRAERERWIALPRATGDAQVPYVTGSHAEFGGRGGLSYSAWKKEKLTFFCVPLS